MQKVTLAVRVFAALGAKVLLVTNAGLCARTSSLTPPFLAASLPPSRLSLLCCAAGGLNPSFRVADVMLITDHISLPCLSGHHPLVGPNDARFGPRFPPVNGIYNAGLQAALRTSAAELGLSPVLREGCYFHDSGPTYESPSEIRAMRVLGGDAVGMSTVPEVLVAAHAGMAVLGLSLITNECRAPGDTGVAPSHEEVLEASDKRAGDVQRLVAHVVGRMDTGSLPAPHAAQVFAGVQPCGSTADGAVESPAEQVLVGALIGAAALVCFVALRAFMLQR